MPQLTMPNVGEGVAEGTVTRWLKQQGDTVALDEPVVEVETDKAVVEIPSPFEGTLARILVQEGEVVPIGTPLADFETAGVAEGATVAESRAETSATPGAARAAAASGEEPERDKSTAPAREREAPAEANGASGNGAGYQRTRRYSPVVLKLASEHNIDLALVRGTGIEGRVTRQDVMRYIENPVANAAPPPEGSGVVGAQERAAPAPAPERPVVAARAATTETQDGGDVTPLTPTRRTIAQRMLESHQTIPVAWMAVEADVTGLVALRQRSKDEFQRVEGVKLTYMPFFVQAIVSALKQHGALNATFTDAGVRVHRRYDIGIAVAAEAGLVVPVVRDAGDKSIAGLARELDALGAKAHARKLTVDDMRGATFTVDNTGAFGSIISQPIVPVGQAAIITTEVIRRELRVLDDDGTFGARSVMNLCISFDHRVLDGAEAGEFMRTVKERLESISADQPVY